MKKYIRYSLYACLLSVSLALYFDPQIMGVLGLEKSSESRASDSLNENILRTVNKVDELAEELGEPPLTDLIIITRNAENGNPHFQVSLGYFYEHGQGVPKDILKAKEWYTKAAAQGHVGGISALGHILYEGTGSSKDVPKAMALFKLAADQNDAYSQAALTKIYYEGTHVPQDYSQAFHWAQKAAQNGNTFAQYYLALMYYEGKGVQKNYEEAYFWAKKSAWKGDKFSLENLSRFSDRLDIAARLKIDKRVRELALKSE